MIEKILFFVMMVLPVVSFGQQGKITILDPSFGRCRMVVSGETFTIMFRNESGDAGKAAAKLINSRNQRDSVALIPVSPPTVIREKHWLMMVKVPKDIHPGLFDLVVSSDHSDARVLRAVKIIRSYPSTFRFVHLSNMNIGDADSPDFDQTLVQEINLLNPEFIIATGDFIEGANRGEIPDAWLRVKKFICQFDSPCYMVCGDQDDEEGFISDICANIFGSLDYGRYRFFFLADTYLHPVRNDKVQISNLASYLRQSKDSLMTFIVGNSDNPSILDGLERFEYNPADIFSSGKVRALISGGSRDWDYKEYAQKLSSAKLSRVSYIRTGQSGTNMKNGGDGVSRYRVFDVEGEYLMYITPRDSNNSAVQHSSPVGRLKVFSNTVNDGRSRLGDITVVNSHARSFSNCRYVFKLSGTDPNSLIVFNGKPLEVQPYQEVPDRKMLVVPVSFDLPEKSAVRIIASTDRNTSSRFSVSPMTVDIRKPDVLRFSKKRTPLGLEFYRAEKTIRIFLRNETPASLTYTPQMTLFGQELMYRIESGASSESRRLTIPSGQSMILACEPAVRQIIPGEHPIIFQDQNDPLHRMKLFPINVEISEDQP